ncbi:MAG TPA: glycosyltransferase family 39 protein [Terriglobales bacterium]|nr:glycosyltransferase family 39 protein [Terriglobales bacterium]
MSHTISSDRQSLSPWVYFIAAVYFAMHMATSTRYGYFRDALYYLACSHHLAFGYVDQPPLIAVLAWIARHTLGTSLPAMIFWPAMAGAVRIILIAAFARELGAKHFGTALAGLLAATPAVWWVIDHQFAMNALEPLFWMGCAYLVLRMIHTRNTRLWLAFGALVGVALENKYSVAIFAIALLIGLALSSERRLLFSGWIAAGATLTFVIFLPNLIWNVQHHWPFLELMHNIRVTGKDVILPPGAYVKQQLLMMNPLSLPFWLGGLLFYLFPRDARPYRAFGFAFILIFAFFMATHGKDYYSAPAYGLLLASGGVATGRLLERASRIQSVLRPVSFAWLVLGIALVLPMVLPVLTLDAFVRYQSHVPIKGAKTERSFEGAVLPQYWADELPWETQVAAVSRVYHSLSPEEQKKTAIFTDNYGQAAAIDFFGAKYGLPKAISGHQNYFLWGPRDYTGEIIIVVGQGQDDVRKYFDSVEVAAKQSTLYALWYENQPILLCRGLKMNLQTHWIQVKHWR